MKAKEPQTAKSRYSPPKPLSDTQQVRTKVEQDIAFLTDRIESMKRQTRPNRVVIDTYEAMLNSRTAVLKWLQHGSQEDTPQQSSRRA